MFKKSDTGEFISLFCILSIVSCALSSGCSTEYDIVTGEQETYYYSTEKEVAMGAAIAKQVENQYKLVEDPLLKKRVDDIGKKIAAVCDRKEIDYHFYVLNEEEVNAFSLPGGYVYINKGLIDKAANDSELAGVIGHEVGHIVARHAIKRLQGAQLYSVLRILTAVTTQSGNVGQAADIAVTQLMLGYSREDEFLADKLGAKYSKLAGYDPQGMVSFLMKLQEVDKRRPLRPLNYFKTHPYVPDRIRMVKQELGGKMDINDYINIEDQPYKEKSRRLKMTVLKRICLLTLPVLFLVVGHCYAETPAEEAFQKGKDYSQKHMYNESISELTKSIQIHPATDVYSYRAYVYLLKNSPDQAISDCNKAIEIDPNNDQAYNNRAAAYQKKGDFDKAISDCNRAIAINPGIPFFYKNRALSYFGKKEYGRSWQDVHKVESLGFETSSFSGFINMLKKASGREK